MPAARPWPSTEAQRAEIMGNGANDANRLRPTCVRWPRRTSRRHELANIQPPTVAKQFQVSHSTAARWVGMARQRDLLPQTTPGKSTIEEQSK